MTKTWAIIGGAATVAAFALGLVLGYKAAPDATPPEIIRETETVTKWLKGDNPSCDDLRACYRAPLSIAGRMSKEWLEVYCGDGCRTAEKKFQMEARPSEPRNVVQLQYQYDFINQAHGGSALYLRRFGRVGVGGGATVSKHAAGILGAAQVEF